MVATIFITTVLLLRSVSGFTSCFSPSSSLIHLKTDEQHLPRSIQWAKKERNTRGKGFGKGVVTEPGRKSYQPMETINDNTIASTSPSDTERESFGLTSIESATASETQVSVDPNLPTDQRTKEILKQKYGLRTFEEQQGDIKAAERIAANSQRMSKIKNMKDDEFDIFMVIPPPIIKAIDLFLKTGLTITTILFVLAGVGICFEAWAVATNNVLPDNIDQFVVNVIEPNFTTGLLVLLGFSISLGIFASAQLGSDSSQYKED